MVAKKFQYRLKGNLKRIISSLRCKNCQITSWLNYIIREILSFILNIRPKF